MTISFVILILLSKLVKYSWTLVDISLQQAFWINGTSDLVVINGTFLSIIFWIFSWIERPCTIILDLIVSICSCCAGLPDLKFLINSSLNPAINGNAVTLKSVRGG